MADETDTKGKRNLPVKSGYKTNRGTATHEGYALVKAYRNHAISGRTREGRWIHAEQNSYARHLGYESFLHVPIGARDYIELIIACKLMLLRIEPGDKTGFRDIATIQNTLARLVRDLGLRPNEKAVGLDDWIETHSEEASEC